MQAATNTPATSSLFTTSTFQKVPIVGTGAATSSTASAEWSKEFRTGETLKAFTENLVDTFSKCFKDYKYSIASAPKRVLTKITELTHNSGFDNSDHDYICTVGGHIYNDGTSTNLCGWLSNRAPGETRTYEILDWLGQGTFGQVIKVQCKEEPSQMLALKIIKNKPAYFTQAHMEVRVLRILNREQDPEDKYNIIRMKDSFVFRKHLCVVFELLSMNLYDVLRQNNFRGVTMTSIRQVSEQLLEALRCLRRARIIHCDLKPENVMISSLTPLRIKLIDFGSACSDAGTLYTYIQSRFYRSPEVLLGLPYTGAIDMWSLGCIAAELYLGLPIFPGTSEYDQVARIVRVLGLPPSRMLEKGGKTKKYFRRDLVTSPARDSDENSEARLVQVEAMTGDLVDLIKFVMSDGEEKHYGKVGGKPAGRFTLGPDEWLVEVQQWLTEQSCLASVAFKTNLGKTETFSGAVRPSAREQIPLKAASGKQVVGLVRPSDGYLQGLTSLVTVDEPCVKGTKSTSVSTAAPGSRPSTRDQRQGSDDTPLPSKDSPDEGEDDEDSGGGSRGHSGDGVSRRKRGQTRSWRLKNVQEYQKDELKKVPPSKKYFNFIDLPSMVDCIPIRQNLEADLLKYEQDRRRSFLQFLEGILNLNPEERWTPKQALGHPLIASEKSPYDPNFAPPRDEEPRSQTPQLDSHDQAGSGANHGEWSSAPSAPSVSANSSAGSSASSPAASSSRGQGRERGHPFARLRGARAGRGDWAGVASKRNGGSWPRTSKCLCTQEARQRHLRRSAGTCHLQQLDRRCADSPVVEVAAPQETHHRGICLHRCRSRALVHQKGCPLPTTQEQILAGKWCREPHTRMLQVRIDRAQPTILTLTMLSKIEARKQHTKIGAISVLSPKRNSIDTYLRRWKPNIHQVSGKHSQ